MLDIMQVEKEEQLQKDVEWQQEKAVSENISLEGPTRKHLRLILESTDTLKNSFLKLDLPVDRFYDIYAGISKIVPSQEDTATSHSR